MFVTVMAVTDKGARHGRATAQAVAEVILSACSAISNYYQTTGGAHEQKSRDLTIGGKTTLKFG
jgi:hypothetical protein